MNGLGMSFSIPRMILHCSLLTIVLVGHAHAAPVPILHSSEDMIDHGGYRFR